MYNLRPIEIFLIQSIFYIVIWLWNDYVGSILSVSIPIIALCILVISLIAEKLERSNIPKWYYTFMVITLLVPLLVAMVFVVLFDGDFEWMKTF